MHSYYALIYVCVAPHCHPHPHSHCRVQGTAAIGTVLIWDFGGNVLCREGVQCNVVYLGGFSMRG